VKKTKPNPFVEIHKDFWEIFTTKYPSYATEYYNSIVKKMIGCGDTSFGYIEYGCLYCGSERHLVAFTCKCKYCLRCGRVFAEDFVNQVASKLYAGIVYRHLILTMPDQLYGFFYKNKNKGDLYSKFYNIGWNFIQDVFALVSKKYLKCGCIMVLHTSGRKSNYRPHLHILVMNGGIDLDTGEWVNIGYFPYEKILPKKWQYHLLNMVKDYGGASVKQLVDDLWKKYPNGFVNFFMKGNVPSKMKQVVKYLSRYIARPSISVKRIIRYDKDKQEVEYEYLSHESSKIEREIVSVLTFIGRMIQQLLPKGFKKVRYYGLQATSSYERSKGKIKCALPDNKLLKNSGVFVVPRSSYEERIKEWTGKNPLECSECGHRMEVINIWIKGKGVVFDLFEKLKCATSPPDDIIKKLKQSVIIEPKEFIEKAMEEIQLQLCFDC